MNQKREIVAELQGVSKSYGKTPALADVDLQVHRGELLSLLGPNGAGKSTAIGLLLGLHRPDQGKVQLFGSDPGQVAARRRMGVMLQSAQLPDTLQVGELLQLIASYYPNPMPVAEVAALAGVAPLLRRRYVRLSGGQQRRVQFALAVCGRPELLFLDEPTVGMDIEARQRMWQTMRDLVAAGCSIVLTTHYLEEAEALSQRVVMLARGRVVDEGSVDSMRARVSRFTIRCRSGLDALRLRQWSQIQDVARDGEYLTMTSAAPEALLRKMLDADPELCDLSVQRAGLAEALLNLGDGEDPAEQEAA